MTTIVKPTPGEFEWAEKLNTALDVLDSKETIDGAQDKATQAYEAGTEYTDARVNELNTQIVNASDESVAPIVDAPLTSAAIAAKIADLTGPVQEADGTSVPGYRYRVIVDPLDPTEIQDIIVEAV